MSFAEGHNGETPVILKPVTTQSQVKNSATALLRFYWHVPTHLLACPDLEIGITCWRWLGCAIPIRYCAADVNDEVMY